MTEQDGGPRRGVLCAGTVVVDVAKVVDVFPSPERLAVIESVALSTGGPALNIAVDLARLQAPFPIEVAGRLGRDAHGSYVLDELAALGIATPRLAQVPEAVTSFTDCMILKADGRREFFHHPGANDLLAPHVVDPASSTAAILHLGAPGLHRAMDAPGPSPAAANGWVELLAAARAAGLRTNLELVSIAADRQRELALPCLPHLDYLIVNEIEASSLLGVELDPVHADDVVDWARLEEVAAGVVRLGVHALVAVHFPGGCVAAAPDGQLWRQGSVRLPAAQVLNATGAGDAFAAGVVYGLHEQWPVQDALRAGVCVAAACLRGATTSDSVGPLSECLALGDTYGYRPVA